MTIHPRYIKRTRKDHRYVFVHKSPDYTQVAPGGVRFKGGKTDPMTPLQAARIAAAMGGRIRYGYCLTEPHVFGDPTEEEREAALALATGASEAPEAKADGSDHEERLRAVFARIDGILEARPELREGYEPPGDLAELTAEFLALPVEERARELKRMEGELDELERGTQGAAQSDGTGSSAGGTGASSESEGGAAGGEQESEPRPSTGEPIPVDRATLEEMGKGALAEWAREQLGITLDQRWRVGRMVDRILEDPRVREVEPEE